MSEALDKLQQLAAEMPPPDPAKRYGIKIRIEVEESDTAKPGAEPFWADEINYYAANYGTLALIQAALHRASEIMNETSVLRMHPGERGRR